jgi:hypothetical protein
VLDNSRCLQLPGSVLMLDRERWAPQLRTLSADAVLSSAFAAAVGDAEGRKALVAALHAKHAAGELGPQLLARLCATASEAAAALLLPLAWPTAPIMLPGGPSASQFCQVVGGPSASQFGQVVGGPSASQFGPPGLSAAHRSALTRKSGSAPLNEPSYAQRIACAGGHSSLPRHEETRPQGAVPWAGAQG